MLINRVAKARRFLQVLNVEAILFSNLRDVRYLTGFTGSEGFLLLSGADAYFLTDSRYITQAVEEIKSCAIIELREKTKDISFLVDRLGVESVGFQAEYVSVALYNELSRYIITTALVPIGPEISTLRIIKDSQEAEILNKCAKIASEALLHIIPEIAPGVVEKELARKLELNIKDLGADDKAFDFIVASGERGAMPHGRASSRRIRNGELLTIDFGAVLDGYNSDETVTISVGKPDTTQRKVYQTVKDAHDIAIESIKPGMLFKELDAVARNHIALKGYGEYFGHGLGHGVGLDVHEKPVISFRSEGEIQEGMVFTIEPGIYIPGWGGVRIEDTVYVTADGCRVLTGVPKDLLVI